MKIRTLVYSLLLLTGLTAGFSQGREEGAIPTRRIAEEIESHDSGTAIWWAGHNSWIIKHDDLVIGTDLVLEDEEPRTFEAPISAEELAPLLDVSFITHGHGDHFGRPTSRILAEKSDCVFVMPANCLETAMRIGIPRERIQIAVPRKEMQVEGITVLPMRALHGNPVLRSTKRPTWRTVDTFSILAAGNCSSRAIQSCWRTTSFWAMLMSFSFRPLNTIPTSSRR